MAVNINIPSQVSQTITDGVTDKAPSENAVNDALGLKANTADLGATAFSNDYNDLDNLPTIPSLTGYVPYTGATSDLDMGTHNITADHISLNVSPSGAGFGVGATQWNNTIGSSETLLKGGSVTLKNGVDLVARVVNKVTPNTTLTKANYQAVKVSGAQGGRLAIGLAQANTDLNSADTIGIVTETIATNQEGFVITVGQLLDINTTGSLQGETWADGDVLYLSPTTAGRLTNIKPTGATGHIVVVGYVEYSHAINGSIYVKIMNGWELDELHNVYINPSTLADNNLLQYDSATSLWKNESLSTAGIQPTLVSGTSIKTINGTTLLGSGDITVGGGITVGTTAVTSGTTTRILLQVGSVVQQSSMLTLNDTGVAGSTTANFANTFKRVGNNFELYGANGGTLMISSEGGGTALNFTSSFQNVHTAGNNHNFRIGTGAPVSAMYINSSLNVGIGTTSPQSRLDVKAQGALSTDIAFRVRNSADNLNNFQVNGDNSIYMLGEGDLGAIRISRQTGHSSLIQHRSTNNLPSILTIASYAQGGSIGQIKLDALNGDGSTPSFTVQRLISGLTDLTGASLYSSVGTNAACYVMKNALGYTGNGIIPTGSPTDHFVMYSADIVAGNAAPHFRTENGNIIKLYRQSSAGITTVADLVTVLTNLGLLA